MEIILLILVLVLLFGIFGRSRPAHRGVFDQRCPHCREMISGSAVACPNCGRDVPKQYWIFQPGYWRGT
jgi:hypothetical protein